MKKEEFISELKLKAKSINLELSDKKAELLYEYKNLVIEWNKNINLTAITEDEEFINKHLIDSLTICKYIENKEKRIIDIGTGAGFPGIPLKIVLENKVVLFDSLNKRLKVLDDITEKLNINNISTLHGRAEETFKNKEYREKFDIATSRAVAGLNILAELMLPAVKVGGKCICMKGNNIEEELNNSKKAIKILGGKIEKVEKMMLPGTNIERNIVIISKIKETPKLYPRKPGTPQKQPIV